MREPDIRVRQNGCVEPGAGREHLTPRWNCFFDLLSVAFAITVTLNDFLKRTPPLCLLKSALVENPVHLPPDGREEEINTSSCLRLAILGGICNIHGLFPLLPHLPHP